MKLTRITAAAAAAAVLLALCGCEESSSSSTSEPVVQQQTTQAAEKIKRDSVSGTFSFDLPDRFSKYMGAYPADFEFLAVDTEKDISAGAMELTGAHITPEYYCNSIKSHYEELYGTVTSTPSEQDGLPAHLLEAEFKDEEDGKELLFYHKAIGYGNGDLLVWVITAPKDAHDEAVKALDDVMKGTKYNGAPVKTDTEAFQCPFFTLTADKYWYFYSTDGYEATVRPNIASTDAEHFGSFKITGQNYGKTAQELAKADEADFSAKDKIDEVAFSEGVEFMGREAVSVSCILRSDYMDLKRVNYYFDNNDACIKVQILAPVDCYDDFAAAAQPMIDLIEIK